MNQADAYAARDYRQAYRIEREAYEHMFTAGAAVAKASVTPEVAVGLHRGGAGNDETAKTVAKQNLEGFAERLGLYFSDIVQNVLAADPLTDAITAHDTHLIHHVDAFAAKDYPKAQQLERERYLQMLGVANTLVGAIQRVLLMGPGVGEQRQATPDRS